MDTSHFSWVTLSLSGHYIRRYYRSKFIVKCQKMLFFNVSLCRIHAELKSSCCENSEKNSVKNSVVKCCLHVHFEVIWPPLCKTLSKDHRLKTSVLIQLQLASSVATDYQQHVYELIFAFSKATNHVTVWNQFEVSRDFLHWYFDFAVCIDGSICHWLFLPASTLWCKFSFLGLNPYNP